MKTSDLFSLAYYPQGQPQNGSQSASYNNEPVSGQAVVDDRNNSGAAEESQWGSSFSEKAIRHAFIKKVFMICSRLI